MESYETRLTLCGCGKLHFRYGGFTMHFDRSEFLLFADKVRRLADYARQEDVIKHVHPFNKTRALC
jgi:hypothetical protein